MPVLLRCCTLATGKPVHDRSASRGCPVRGCAVSGVRTKSEGVRARPDEACPVRGCAVSGVRAKEGESEHALLKHALSE